MITDDLWCRECPDGRQQSPGFLRKQSGEQDCQQPSKLNLLHHQPMTLRKVYQYFRANGQEIKSVSSYVRRKSSLSYPSFKHSP